MERYGIRTRELIFTLLAALVGTSVGCANQIDQAREAWAEGQGDFTETEELYREALTKPRLAETAKGELFEVYITTAKNEAKQGKYKRAADHYRLALELKSGDLSALEGLARMLRELYKYDEALEYAQEGIKRGCGVGCRRLRAALLVQRADQFTQQNQWDEAERDYTEALTVIPDGMTALGLVRCRYAQQDLDGSIASLKQARDLIGPEDVQAQQHYLELRRVVVVLALSQGKAEIADDLLDLIPEGVPIEAQIGLSVDVALDFTKAGKADMALERLTELVQAAAEGKIVLNDQQRELLRVRVAELYAARAGQRVSEGDLSQADADIGRARALAPELPSLALQQVLLHLVLDRLDEAKQSLEEVPESAEGYDQVSAIVIAREVERLVQKGKIEDARAQLKDAQAMAGELPEVRIATARVLAATEPDGLLKKELAQLRFSKLVKYPKRKVTRLAEALAELTLARKALEGEGSKAPYRAADSLKRIEAFEAELRAIYPLPVEFVAEAQSVLTVKNAGTEPIELTVEGRDGASLARPATLAAGEGKTVTIKRPGLVTLGYGNRTAVWLAEPHTKVEVGL